MLVPVLAGPDVLAGAGPALAWLRPGALASLAGDPLLSAVILTLGLNVLAFCAASLATVPSPMERLQASRFVRVFDRAERPRARPSRAVGAGDLLVMAQRILGAAQARALFAAQASLQGRPGAEPAVTPALLERLEGELAGSVGAATAHAMMTGIAGGAAVSLEDLMAVADETAQLREVSARLEARSAELRAANARLTAAAEQKDAFLSQVSHELRTPMTSIRAFAEILGDAGSGPDAADRARYAAIIRDESRRLTRLLDDLIDPATLAGGPAPLALRDVRLGEVIDAAVAACGPGGPVLRRDRAAEAVSLRTDPDRLAQVFINVMANAAKYCDAPVPTLTIEVAPRPGAVVVDLVDNGSEVAPGDRAVIFERFARAGAGAGGAAGGAGLGLAICREVMTRLGGSIDYLPGRGGAAFRVTHPAVPDGE